MNQQTWTEQQLEALKADRNELRMELDRAQESNWRLQADLSTAKAENQRLREAIGSAFHEGYQSAQSDYDEYHSFDANYSESWNKSEARKAKYLSISHEEAK